VKDETWWWGSALWNWSVEVGVAMVVEVVVGVAFEVTDRRVVERRQEERGRVVFTRSG
jgi:hypothetical protein